MANPLARFFPGLSGSGPPTAAPVAPSAIAKAAASPMPATASSAPPLAAAAAPQPAAYVIGRSPSDVELLVTPITKIKFEVPPLLSGMRVATNDFYISYPVKKGKRCACLPTFRGISPCRTQPF